MPTDFNALHAWAEELYAGAPGRGFLVRTALADIQSAISSLANLGHHFELTGAEPPPAAAFPKMFYHPDGRTLTIHSEEIAGLLSPEWSERQGSEPASEVPAPAPPPPAPPPPVMLTIGDDGRPMVEQGGDLTSLESPLDP